MSRLEQIINSSPAHIAGMFHYGFPVATMEELSAGIVALVLFHPQHGNLTGLATAVTMADPAGLHLPVDDILWAFTMAFPKESITTIQDILIEAGFTSADINDAMETLIDILPRLKAGDS